MKIPNNIQAAIDLVRNGPHRIISFDVFDTLVFRPYMHPHDVFRHLGLIYNEKEFADARITAENVSVSAQYDGFIPEITYDFIYENMPKKFRHFKSREIELEIQTIQPNPEMRPVFDAAVSSGKTVIIASDMYLPSDVIKQILRKCGFVGYNHLYISSELGRRKSTGGLFNHIIEHLGCRPGDILHIGDNPHSDESAPMELGISTALYPPIMANMFEQMPHELRDAAASDVGLSIVTSMCALRTHASRGGTPLTDMGYKYAGPAIWGYARFVADVAKSNGIKKLLFMARDGQALKHVFDEMHTGIHTQYAFAGRVLNNTGEDAHPGIFSHKTDFQKYIRRITRGRHVGMVDGQTRNFSSQKIIETISGKKISGIYYFVFTNDPTGTTIANQYTHAEFMPRDSLRSTDVIEFLMTSDELPITGVDADGNFIYQSNPHKLEAVFRNEKYPQIERGIHEFMNDRQRIFGDHDIFITGPGMHKLVVSMLNKPTGDEMSVLTTMQFGTDKDHQQFMPFLRSGNKTGA